MNLMTGCMYDREETESADNTDLGFTDTAPPSTNVEGTAFSGTKGRR